MIRKLSDQLQNLLFDICMEESDEMQCRSLGKDGRIKWVMVVDNSGGIVNWSYNTRMQTCLYKLKGLMRWISWE